MSQEWCAKLFQVCFDCNLVVKLKNMFGFYDKASLKKLFNAGPGD